MHIRVASASSGPTPSPGIRVTSWAMAVSSPDGAAGTSGRCAARSHAGKTSCVRRGGFGYRGSTEPPNLTAAATAVKRRRRAAPGPTGSHPMICPPIPPARSSRTGSSGIATPSASCLHMVGIPPTILGVLLIPIYLYLPVGPRLPAGAGLVRRRLSAPVPRPHPGRDRAGRDDGCDEAVRGPGWAAPPAVPVAARGAARRGRRRGLIAASGAGNSRPAGVPLAGCPGGLLPGAGRPCVGRRLRIELGAERAKSVQSASPFKTHFRHEPINSRSSVGLGRGLFRDASGPDPPSRERRVTAGPSCGVERTGGRAMEATGRPGTVWRDDRGGAAGPARNGPGPLVTWRS